MMFLQYKITAWTNICNVLEDTRYWAWKMTIIQSDDTVWYKPTLCQIDEPLILITNFLLD